MEKTKKEKRVMRHKRVRAKIVGTKEQPRLSVFKSNKYIYAQLVDDENSKILTAASDRDLKSAYEVGKLLAKKAVDKGIKKVVFDRSGYKFHGAISSLARGAREGGLKF